MTRETVQVRVLDRRGDTLTLAQWRTQEDADAYIARLPEGWRIEVTTGPVVTERVKATNLSQQDRLADGTSIDRLYTGRDWVRVTGFAWDYSRVVRRRYRHEQLVEIEARG